MVNLLNVAPELNAKTKCCRAIVETPQGSRSKYDYEPDTGLFRLAAVLPAGMAFPLSFGFVPSTLGEDGDPLDILVLSDEPIPRGTLVTVQLLGVIEAEQTEEGNTVRNDRLIGKVSASHAWADVNNVRQLGQAFSRDLARFFETYNELRGRSFVMLGLKGAAVAVSLIRLGQKKSS